jgi:hypothetical protein
MLNATLKTLSIHIAQLPVPVPELKILIVQQLQHLVMLMRIFPFVRQVKSA